MGPNTSWVVQSTDVNGCWQYSTGMLSFEFLCDVSRQGLNSCTDPYAQTPAEVLAACTRSLECQECSHEALHRDVTYHRSVSEAAISFPHIMGSCQQVP